MSEAFNVEEFLVFGSEIPSENIQESSQEPASNWPAYPDMFPAEEQRLKEDPISLISFEGASLYKEEYVDPFASLSPKYEANSRDFLTKLQLRRKKLDNLARNLQSKNPLEQWTHLEDSLLVLPWQKEVQVYSLFNVESNTLATGAHQDFSKQLSSEAYLARKMLDFFQQSLPEYLAIM